ncbi:endo alpha-1,4 polygalactosaminidase [Nocardiopsis alba]|uniref:endo alpha-1,4 polygalactosaminidase n=1 Tax=Nocardiopsis alba TaxID=53437 RepID=UPI0033E91DAA
MVRGRGRVAVVFGAVVLALSGVGCAPDRAVELPPEGGFDYQLGGAYPPPEGVTTVVRDSTAEPAPGLYSVCYVNGFQTQPDELDRWLDEDPDLVLRDEDGEPVVDPGWPDERILDTSTGERRERIAEILTETIDRCADAGFDAVEFDNLDSYLRSGEALTVDDNLALASVLVGVAHGRGLAAAQKNTAEEAGRGHDEVGFDLAVTESCAAWHECGAYTGVYGSGNVLAVEYPEELAEAALDFDVVCADPERPDRVLLRDAALVPSSDPEHLFEAC